jgi:hypothetical protein
LTNAAGQAQGQGGSKGVSRSPSETEGLVGDSLNQAPSGARFFAFLQSSVFTTEDAEDPEEEQEQKSMRELKPSIGEQSTKAEIGRRG